MRDRPSQADRLLKLLKDGQWHSTPEILAVVYGTGHSGIARIGARIADLKERGHQIEGKRDEHNPTVYHYRLLVKPKPQVEYVERNGVMHARFLEPPTQPTASRHKEFSKM